MIFPVPPPKPRAHPRYDDVVAQQQSIAQWEMQREIRNSLAARRARRGSAICWSASLLGCVGFALLSIAGHHGPAVGVAGLSIGLALAARRIPVPSGPIGQKPFPLEIVPYTRWENDYLLSRQHQQPFTARCACPGCGYVGVHLINPNPCPVPWGNVIRQCGVCSREWAQS